MLESAGGTVALGKPHVRGVGGVPVRHDGEDITILQPRLDRGDSGFGDVGDGKIRDVTFDTCHLRNHRGIVPQVTRVPDCGLCLHVTDAPSQGNSAERSGYVFSETSPLIVGENFLEVVHATDIGPVASTSPIALQLDIVEKGFPRPERRGIPDEAGHCEGGLVEGPAIQPVEIDRRRFDPVVGDWSPRQREILDAIARLSASTAPGGGGADDYAPMLTEDFSRWTIGSDVLNGKEDWVEGVRSWFDDGWRVSDRQVEVLEITVEGDTAFSRRIVSETYAASDGEISPPAKAALAEVWRRDGEGWRLKRVTVHPIQE